MRQVSFQSVYNVTTSRGQFKIGERVATPDGREWVYVKGAGTIGAFKVAIPNTVTSVDTVSSSTDSESRIVYITEASAGWTPGAYEDHIAYIDDGTGKGQYGKIKTNTADTIELYPENALTTALAVADSDLTIYHPHEVIIAAITTKTQNAVGVTQVAFTSSDFGWILTKGVGSVYAGEVLTVGGSFVTGDDTTGQVVKGTTAKGEFDEQTLGRCLVANAAADDPALVFVNIQ